MQLVNHEEQDIELTYRSKTRRHFAYATDEFFRRVVRQRQHGHELAQTSRRDADAMQRAHVAIGERGQPARKLVRVPLQKIRWCGRVSHVSGGPFHYS